MNLRLILIVCVFVSWFQMYCASRGRPGGGPVDKTPPTIVNTFPAADSTSVAQINEIKFLFSERMNEASIRQSVFISPPLEYELEISGGDELILNLRNELSLNQTYVVTIGAAAKDIRNNPMQRSYQLAFSTGPVIDRGKISGRIFGIKSGESFFVYAYRIQSPDTVSPIEAYADYLTQPGSDFSYELDYLAPASYRVFVVEDQNKNLRLDADFERVGIPFRDVKIDSSTQTFQPLNFRITRMDTTAPILTGIRPINRSTLQLRFSEPLGKLTVKNISIADTLTGKHIDVLEVAPAVEEANQYFIFTTEHDSGQGYRIEVDATTDTSGIIGSAASFTYGATVNQDTSRFRIIALSPADSALNLDIRTNILLEFSKAVKTDSVEKYFICRQDAADTLNMNWEWIESRKAMIHPVEGFQPGTVYNFSLTTEKMVSLWNESLPDTIIYRTFQMKSPDEYGSISGKAEIQHTRNPDIYIFIQSLRRGQRYTIPADADYRFLIEWVPEDNYQIGGFVDLNGDQKLTAGQLIPFRYAEPFHWNTDTVRVRKRWEMSDVQIKIPAGAE